MPRIARHAPGGLVYHVLNRGVGRSDLFDDAGDYLAFLRVFRDVLEEVPIRVCGYCLMSNHWHLVLWPKKDGELARFGNPGTGTVAHADEPEKGRQNKSRNSRMEPRSGGRIVAQGTKP